MEFSPKLTMCSLQSEVRNVIEIAWCLWKEKCMLQKLLNDKSGKNWINTFRQLLKQFLSHKKNSAIYLKRYIKTIVWTEKVIENQNKNCVHDKYFSMTQLLTHSVAQPKPSSMPKTNNQSNKKFLSLAVSWVKVVKNWVSF